MPRNRSRPPYFWWAWWWELRDGKPGDSVSWCAVDMPLKSHESSKAVLDCLTRAGKAMQFAGVLKHPTQVRRANRDREIYFQLALVEERKSDGHRREPIKARDMPKVHGFQRKASWKASEPVKTARMLLVERKHGKAIDELIIEAYATYGPTGASKYLGIAHATLMSWAKQWDILFFHGAAKRENLEKIGLVIQPVQGLPVQTPGK